MEQMTAVLHDYILTISLYYLAHQFLCVGITIALFEACMI